MHKLKKYPNRRLYDVTDSKYVTVEDVRKLIVKGESIEVVDSKDQTDLTRTVLLQILAEQEQDGHGTVLTNRTIEQLIRFYGDRFGRVASRYIEEAIQTFLEHQDLYRDRMRQLNELNPFNMMRQAFDATFQASTDKPGSSTGKPSDSTRATGTKSDDGNGDQDGKDGKDGKGDQ